jgi:hypothetical protein
MVTPLEKTRRGFFASPSGWVFCAFAAIALFFVIAEHRAHLGFVVPYLPLALIGVCVVLHSYMHGLGHGRYSDEKPEDEKTRDRADHHHH